MSRIDPAEVRRIARLAALAVADDELPALTEQLERILDYVSQIESVAEPAGPSFRPGPARAPLRRDQITRCKPPIQIEHFAPAMEDGLFVVPKLPAMDGE